MGRPARHGSNATGIPASSGARVGARTRVLLRRRLSKYFRTCQAGLALSLSEPAALSANTAIRQFLRLAVNGKSFDRAIHEAAMTGLSRAIDPLPALMFPAGAGKTHPVLDWDIAFPQARQELLGHRDARCQICNLTRCDHHPQYDRSQFGRRAWTCLCATCTDPSGLVSRIRCRHSVTLRRVEAARRQSRAILKWGRATYRPGSLSPSESRF